MVHVHLTFGAIWFRLGGSIFKGLTGPLGLIAMLFPKYRATFEILLTPGGGSVRGSCSVFFSDGLTLGKNPGVGSVRGSGCGLGHNSLPRSADLGLCRSHPKRCDGQGQGRTHNSTALSTKFPVQKLPRCDP